MKIFINSVIFFLIWGFTLTVFGQFEGEPCKVKRTNTDGICKPINKCPPVRKNIQNRRRDHTRCGFVGRMEIVCCPGEQPVEVKPNCTEKENPRLHEQKCKEYKSAIYEYIYAGGLTVDSDKQKIPINKCGHTHIPLIVGGTVASPREFPHMALIGFDTGDYENTTNWACGGTLISDRYILTAAHCLHSRAFGEPKYIRLGDLDIDSEKDESQKEDFNIEKIIPHPDWRLSNKYNDIGLIKLDSNVELSPFKRPACLPNEFEGKEKHSIASGWGKTNWAGQSSNILQKVTLDNFNHTECNEIYSTQINRRLKDGIRSETQMCAGSRDSNKDTCQGDSGGPLQVYHECEYCMYTIIGITSFGISCGNVGVPGVYTRVFPYIDWIEKIVWES